MTSLDLGVVGNCSIGALIDFSARMVWCCQPRFDGDPVFCHLLGNETLGEDGAFTVELEGFAASEQFYVRNSAVLTTRLTDDEGNAVDVIDFAPRFDLHGRRFRPMTIIRRIMPVQGSPRVRIRLRPRYDYGAVTPRITHGSNHIRYAGPDLTLRLT
ncbi:MAG: trehalase-like domain-containing protein, partial [Gammaproteobacteria bacterium]|nr:trehalase-like domain-containing protein [Gammaproteobacteria bacterium]